MDPRIYLMDFQHENSGDTMLKFRENLEYIGVEES